MRHSNQPLQLSLNSRRNAFLWIFTLLCLSLFIGWKFNQGAPFYSDITELLPDNQHQPEVFALEQKLDQQFSKQVLLLLRATDEKISLRLAQTLQERLLASPYLSKAALQERGYSDLQILYQPFQNQLLSADMRRDIEQKTPRQLAEEAAQALFNPAALARPNSFSNDPFNIAGQWLHSSQSNSAVEIANGQAIISAARGNWYVIHLELIDASPFDLSPQNSILPIVDTFEQELNTSGTDYELLKSGIIFHAGAGADLARSEISTVGIGSLLAIAILVLLVFRSGAPFIGVLIALASGLISALSVSLLVFDRIHLLTLAFGSTLLGIAVDYCFHFMINSQQLGCSQRCRKLIAPALATSALSSIAAYLLQLTTPFPGIQQMAVFSAAGLAGTWLAVMALGPFYRPSRSATIDACCAFFQRTIRPCYQQLRMRHRLYMGITCGLFLISAYILQIQPGNNDVRTLNTSGEALLQDTKRVEQLLQPASSSRFFIVSAASLEQLQETLEQLQRELQPLHQRRLVQAEQSLAHWLPSETRQRSDHDLISEKLYRQALPELCSLLAMSQSQCRDLQRSAEQPLNSNLELSDVAKHTALAALLPVKIGQGFHAAMLLSLNPLATDSDLTRISDNIHGVRFVNRADNLSDLLVEYRQAVGSYLALALLLIGAILLYRYRLCGVRILIPMVLSSLLGLAIAAQCCGITVFHLLAVLLVVGIALDTGIFYREMGLNGESWLAASLSSLTSVLAFGLLALSQVPVLHQFGVVVLTGILSSWLLTPLFFAGREDCAVEPSTH